VARLLYVLLLYLAAPFIGLRLLWRGCRQRAYWRHPGERWGFYPQGAPAAAPLIWIHAVSVGETRAAEPLLEKLLAAYPGHIFLLTCMTPTGRETATRLYAQEARVRLAYLPYDYPGAVARFLRHFRPCLGILMETEIWPNLMAATARAKTPVVLVNARLSRRSARAYARVAALARPALRQLAAVAAQGRADARRFTLLGASCVRICGNLKFDARPHPETLRRGEDWRVALGERLVWLAASTREGEEALLLDVYQRLARPDLLLLLAPRHPQRFDAVADLATNRHLALQRRSRGLPEPKHQIWLGDSMGEMAAYYRLADWAFVGGSLLPLGGQNLIEAAACGCPALIGPHTFNFAQASAAAIAAGAARRVADVDELAQAVEALLNDPAARRRMSSAGLSFAAAHQGAAARIGEIIESLYHREKNNGLAFS
jgi:3-deoxy-D-manno-octulosonic-acid transferase